VQVALYVLARRVEVAEVEQYGGAAVAADLGGDRVDERLRAVAAERQ
jgi:hypothetical protein